MIRFCFRILEMDGAKLTIIIYFSKFLRNIVHIVDANVQFEARNLPKLCSFVQDFRDFCWPFPSKAIPLQRFSGCFIQKQDPKRRLETQNYYF